MTLNMLVVDDDIGFRSAANRYADLHKFSTDSAATLAEARQLLQGTHFDLVLLDLTLPDGSGFDLLEDKALNADHIAMITGNPSVESASRAVASPVHEYLVKPLQGEQLDALLRRIADNAAGPPLRDSGDHCGDLFGRSPAMRSVFHQIRRVAPTELTTFIIGESGTGKELVAQAIHQESGRSGPFVALNCAAVAPELLASELFGHERGSFTGAHRQHHGCFERAQGGTVFLDEITEMPAALQAHLLRVLEARTITRVGGQTEIDLDIRVIAASNRDPWKAVRDGVLREDLLYRLVDFPIQLPPLRQRDDDAVLLARLFLERLNRAHATQVRFAADAEAALRHHDWPGNVRELMHCVRRGYLLAERDLLRIEPGSRRRSASWNEDTGMLSFPIGATFEEMQRAMLLKTLEHFNQDKTRTARALGVSVKTVYNHLARIDRSEGEQDVGDGHDTRRRD